MPLMEDVLSVLIYVFILVIIIGLLRPWYVLWFMDRKNRWLVFKTYGLLLGILILLKVLLTNYS